MASIETQEAAPHTEEPSTETVGSTPEVVDELDELGDFDFDFDLDEVENKIAPLALA